MDFEIPEDITGLTGDALADHITAARAHLRHLNAVGDDEFDAEAANKVMDHIDAVTAKKDKDAADAAEAQRIADTRARAKAASVEPIEEEADEPGTEEPPAEPIDEPGGPTPEDAETKEPVLASGKKEKARVVRRAAAGNKEPELVLPNRAAPTITAAADVPGFTTGGTLNSLDDVAQGFIERYAAMPKGKVGSTFNRYGVAMINKGRDDGLNIDKFRSVQDLLQAASVEKRLPGGSLVAAGGWCAPSETLYDLCSIESTDGLWDLPEVQVNRGGIQFTKGPSFEDFYAYAATAFQTEAEAEAGTEKICIPVECPPFEEVRLDAMYACISAGILTNAAYPELIRRYIEGVLIAQQHAASARLIAEAEAITGAAIAIPDVFPTITSLLHALELVAEGERERFRMSRSATLEVILPFWVRPALRADLANRTGVELTNVTDGMLDAHFSNRGIRVQWVYNYQPLDVDTAGIATDYPTTLETIMYPAGTFVKLTDDVIRLDAVYDSVGLSTNTYTAMFAEEGIALANVCHDPRRLSLDVCVSGRTGAADISACFGIAGV